ncbi:MAG: SPOR domain-containing protein [Hyphomicrobiales bacterium]|nr:SPOR domain-containing protein [Hyphomicrobiales bacterium]
MPRSDDPTNPRGGNPNNRQGYPVASDPARRNERPDYRQPQPQREPARSAYDQYSQSAEPQRRAEPQRAQYREQHSAPQPRQAAPAPRDEMRYEQDQRRSEDEIAQAIEARQPKPQAYMGDQFHQPQRQQVDAERAREAAYMQQTPHTNDLYDDPHHSAQSQEYSARDYQPAYDPHQDMHDDYGAAQHHERATQYPAAASNVAPLFLPSNVAQSADLMQEHEDYFQHDEPVNLRAQGGRGAPAHVTGDQHRQYADAQDSLNMDEFDDYPLGSGLAPANLAPAPRRQQEDSLDADFFDDEDFDPAAELKQKKRGGKALMAAMFVGALVVGGGAAYYFTMMESGSSGDGQPPTLVADAGQIKETPESSGGREFPNQSKKIYERLDTGEGAAEGGSALTTASTAPESGSLDDRIEKALRQARKPGESDPAPVGGRSPGLDDPRPVKTYTYGPDGSQLPSSQPSVDTSIVVTGADLGASPSAAPPRPADTRQQAVRPAAPQPAPRPVQATPPAPRPQPQIAANAQTATAVAAPAGAYFLQLKSANDQAKAQTELADMQQKYSSVLGAYGLNIKSVDLGDKGVWFRIRATGFESKDTASGMCEKLKAAGLKDCLVRAESQG